jgi:hypothetical protein
MTWLAWTLAWCVVQVAVVAAAGVAATWFLARRSPAAAATGAVAAIVTVALVTLCAPAPMAGVHEFLAPVSVAAKPQAMTQANHAAGDAAGSIAAPRRGLAWAPWSRQLWLAAR